MDYPVLGHYDVEATGHGGGAQEQELMCEFGLSHARPLRRNARDRLPSMRALDSRDVPLPSNIDANTARRSISWYQLFRRYSAEHDIHLLFIVLATSVAQARGNSFKRRIRFSFFTSIILMFSFANDIRVVKYF